MKAIPLPSLFKSSRLLLLALAIGGHLWAAPVELRFSPPGSDANPFSREIWARVETPSERVLELPAFYLGQGNWAVRARAEEKGNYRLLDATEFLNDVSRPLNVSMEDRGRVRVRNIDETGGPIAIDRRSGLQFIDGRGQLYVPLGGNLPWAPSGQAVEDYYAKAFADFRQVGFNWTRIWMCHWGQLNLDWVEPENGEQPALGTLDLGVAQRLDRLIQSAEENGVRLQLVLQHHGQYTTFNNSNWAENPWNAAQGGFLDDPKAFFTDERARQLTRDKYRYIVARWGYSSAIMAWELFNEVMWTNSRRGDAADNAAVAAWHTEMARHLRRYDVHDHLVTTSDDDLKHAMWSAMDFYQPHLYATNMVLGLQALDLDESEIDRPVFYGEMGDDNMINLSSEQRASGFVHSILAWSGLFGRATQPAQLWYVETLRQNERWSEIESLGAFVRASGILRRPLPHLEHPLVIGGASTSLSLTPGPYWHRSANPVVDIPTDGTQPPELMHVLRILNDPADHGGFPSRMTLRLSSPAASNATLHLARIGNRGGSLRVRVDETVVVDERWPAATSTRPTPTRLSFPFRLGFGDHRIVIENPAGPDWIDLGGLDLGLPVPALTAVARRDPERIVLWVHHRDNLLSPEPNEALTPSAATVQLAEVPAGEWTLTWWDTSAGRSGGSTTIQHPGGALMVETPEITRHQAAWLERLK